MKKGLKDLRDEDIVKMMGSQNTNNGMNLQAMTDLMKTQYLFGAIRGVTENSSLKEHGPLITMLAILLFEQLSRVFPAWFEVLTTWFKNHWTWEKGSVNVIMDGSVNREGSIVKHTEIQEKEIKASVVYNRTSTDSPQEQRINAVLHHVCNLPSAKSLRFNGIEMMPHFQEAIEIDSDIWFQVNGTKNDSAVIGGGGGGGGGNSVVKSVIEPISYRLFTYDHDITYIHRCVDRLIDQFEKEKKNRLKNEIYYFDLSAKDTNGNRERPVFRMSKFHTNRTLQNIYFRQADELRERVNFFLHRRDWYDNKGIPRTLGIVMYGHPGCGKSSTIKALSNVTKRHIFNINLSEVKTKEAFKNLFYNETVDYLEDTSGKIESIHIPIRNRIYVFEDAERENTVLIKREILEEEAEKKRQEEIAKAVAANPQAGNAIQSLPKYAFEEKKVEDKLDLGTVLNVLDGVRENPDRIVVLTTNYPERLDPALLRPGRFDLMLQYEKHGREVLVKHMESFYETTLNMGQRDAILNCPDLDEKWTPAEVGQIFFRYYNNVDKAIETLILEKPETLFTYSYLRKDYKNPEEVGGVGGSNLDDLLRGMDDMISAEGQGT